MTQKIEQWMRDAAKEIRDQIHSRDRYVSCGDTDESVAAIIASHAPSEAAQAWSECPRCDNGIHNGRECAICWGTGRVTESLLQQEAAAQPTCVACGHPEHTDEHAGISHLPVTKAHAFVPNKRRSSK